MGDARKIRSWAVGALTWFLVGAASHAFAAPRGGLDIPAQDLDDALRKLADTAQIELLFDHATVARLRSHAIRGPMEPGQALKAMLADTPLSYRRTAVGAYVIVAAPSHSIPLAKALSEPEAATAISEILISGRRTQNVDIRRSVNDIQPYKVLSSNQIGDAQADDVEDLLRQHLTADTVLGALRQGPVVNVASSRSRVNLHGMGVDQTLVLVDGRRMPATPAYLNFGQPDLNGLPQLAIERIESLSTTANGIYGSGATGGMVNIVLKRNYSGGEIETGGGVTQRGDAPQWRASVAMGHAWFDERLRLFAAVGYSHEGGLAIGDRAFAQSLRHSVVGVGPVSNAWNVVGADFQSFAPLSVNLNSAEGLAALLANRGSVDSSLSDDGQGLKQSLLTQSNVVSGIASGRLEVSDRIQLFFDVLAMQNAGKAIGPRLDTSDGLEVERLAPFTGSVRVTFPTPGWSGVFTNRSRTVRGSLGAIARLGGGWNAELDVSLGEAAIRSRRPADFALGPLVRSGELNILAGWAAVEAALASYEDLPSVTVASTNRFGDASLRASGTLFTAPAGPVTLTATVEARRNRTPKVVYADLGSSYVDPEEARKGEVEDPAAPYQRQDETVYSAYVETRVPIFGADTSPWLLRGLELQAAVRGDRYAYRIPLLDTEADFVTSRGDTVSTTFGFKVWPLEGVMLRGSYATGSVRANVHDMQPHAVEFQDALDDPKRPGESVDRPYRFVWYGSPDLRPERARSVTLGVVAIPHLATGLRLSVDYTHLIKTREVSHYFDFDEDYVLAHEDSLPGRVIRAPLTEADRAKGYTGGVITQVDTSAINFGHSAADMVEISIEYRLATGIGTFQSFAEGTWVPRFRRVTTPEQSAFNVVGALDGPLRLRGDFGVQWLRGGWSIGLSGRADDGYRVSYADTNPIFSTADWSADNILTNGREKVPPQVYFDADISYRPHALADRRVVCRFGVRNLFDRDPPVVRIYLRPDDNMTDLSSYSTVGDPRGRRFVASVSARF